jgi:hypothetical protein
MRQERGSPEPQQLWLFRRAAAGDSRAPVAMSRRVRPKIYRAVARPDAGCEGNCCNAPSCYPGRLHDGQKYRITFWTGFRFVAREMQHHGSVGVLWKCRTNFYPAMFVISNAVPELE